MNRSLCWSAVAVAGMFLSASCPGDCGDALAPTQVAILDGEYVSTLQEGNLASTFPHVGGSDFELTVDRSAGRVEVRYVKDGEQVTERWRISGVTLR